MMKRISWSLLLIFTIILSLASCFSTHHRYRDAEDSIAYEDNSDENNQQTSHSNVNSFYYRNRNNFNYDDESSRSNRSDEGIVRSHKERSQHKNHHHHYQQPQKHARNDEEDETVTAASVNHHHHHLPPVMIKNGSIGDAIILTNNNKKRNKHSKKMTQQRKEPEINNFLLLNNLNDDNNNDDDDEVSNFAETRNTEEDQDRLKDKFQFDLPDNDVDFERVMQNSNNKFNSKRRNDDDEDSDDDEKLYDSANEEDDGTVIDQFPSEIIVSTIEKEDQIVKQQQQQQQQKHHKGSKLLEKRHKINDEGPTKKLMYKQKLKATKTMKGDLSCMRDEDFIPAPAIENADIKYLRNDIYGVENSFLEAEYHCHKGYKLVSLSLAQDDQGEQVSAAAASGISSEIVMNTTNLICHNKEWVGNFIVKCVKIKKGKNLDKLCSSDNKCEQMCYMRNHTGVEQCSCYKGFKMVDNACVDINECTETRNNCEHQCINTIGSYTCRCMPGFEYDGKHKCKDINECTRHGNTRGPCQDKCINLPGSYKCVCNTGTKLSIDGHSCVSSAAISQQTLSSSATVVSVCPRGYYFNYTNDECEDFDECSVNNGGCQDICTNTDGSYYCSCQSGYIFGPDNKTCVVNNMTSDITCPPLIPPKHGYLECSRPLDESRHHIANFPGSQCVLRCPNGFRVMGRYSQICGNDGQWQGSGDGACMRYPKPKLICPKNMVLETPPNDTRVVLPLPRPTTDVSWDTDITISPNYVKDLNLVLSGGVENITYTATHPISRLRVSCQFSVNVIDGMPPVVKFCPETQHYTVAKHHETIKVSWIEPIFEDNIKVTAITKSNEPGNHLGLGTHLITYEAKDAAGFTSRCTFKIVINAPKRQILPLLYSKFYYL